MHTYNRAQEKSKWNGCTDNKEASTGNLFLHFSPSKFLFILVPVSFFNRINSKQVELQRKMMIRNEIEQIECSFFSVKIGEKSALCTMQCSFRQIINIQLAWSEQFFVCLENLQFMLKRLYIYLWIGNQSVTLFLAVALLSSESYLKTSHCLSVCLHDLSCKNALLDRDQTW